MTTAPQNDTKKHLGPMQTRVLSIVANFETDGATACLQLPEERAAAKRLAARGILKIVRVGKFAGMEELFVETVQ